MKNSQVEADTAGGLQHHCGVCGVAFFLALSNFDAVKEQLASWVRIIAPFIWGLALAYLLDGPVRFFEKKFHGHRGFAIVLACVLAVLVVSFLIGMVVPQVVESLMMLLNRVPEYMENLNQFIKNANINLDGAEELIGSYQELLTRVTGLISAMLPKVVGYGMAIGSGLVSAITAVISSIYMLMSKDKLLRQLKKVVLGSSFRCPGHGVCWRSATMQTRCSAALSTAS